MSSESQQSELPVGSTVSVAWGTGSVLCTVDHTYRNASGAEMVVALLPRGSALDDRDVTVAVPRSDVRFVAAYGLERQSLTDEQKAHVRHRMALAVLHDRTSDPVDDMLKISFIVDELYTPEGVEAWWVHFAQGDKDVRRSSINNIIAMSDGAFL